MIKYSLILSSKEKGSRYCSVWFVLFIDGNSSVLPETDLPTFVDNNYDLVPVDELDPCILHHEGKHKIGSNTLLELGFRLLGFQEWEKVQKKSLGSYHIRADCGLEDISWKDVEILKIR